MTHLITRTYNNQPFAFREDGWINMTKAAAAFGKDLQSFIRMDETREYIAALQANSVPGTDFVEAKRGNGGGTYAHPKLAVFFARWLDVKFAVFCDMVIDDLIKGKAEITITKPQESAALALPQDYLTALKALVAAEESRKELALENARMAQELNVLTVDEWRALAHLSFRPGQASRLGKRCRKLCAAEGIAVNLQKRTLYLGAQEIETSIGEYPRHVIERAALELGIA